MSEKEVTESSEQEQIVIGSKATQDVVCSHCGKTTPAGEYFSYQGKGGKDIYLCDDCRAKVNTELENQSKDIPYAQAIILGSLASALGAYLWYQITLTIKAEFSLVSIGLGYLIGYAMFYGSGKKRSVSLQNISAGLTAISIFCAEYLIFTDTLYQYMLANPTRFTDWGGDKIWIDPWNPLFLESIASPIGLLIYAIGIYVAYRVCKPYRI